MNTKTNEKNDIATNDMFEIHTMKKDAESLTMTESVGKKDLPQDRAQLDSKQQQYKNVPQHPSANPFLENGNDQDESAQKRTTFGARRSDEPTVEKINYSPADIAPKPAQSDAPVAKKKNSLLVSMMVFVIIFLCGVAGFGFYLWQKNVATNTAITPDTEDTTVMTNDDLLEDTPIEEDVYTTTVPNYFTIDVESPEAKSVVVTELATIEQELANSDITDPVPFIVTDQNDYPISFHVFALSTGMMIPMGVSAALEEGFEIYAYNDPRNGVRFAFVVDVKNINALQEALTASEQELPQVLSLVLDGVDTTPSAMVFKDSTYNTHPIRYVNLDTEESYSVDYTITNQKLVIGTSKETLRAVLDVIKSQTTFGR